MATVVQFPLMWKLIKKEQVDQGASNLSKITKKKLKENVKNKNYIRVIPYEIV